MLTSLRFDTPERSRIPQALVLGDRCALDLQDRLLTQTMSVRLSLSVIRILLPTIGIRRIGEIKYLNITAIAPFPLKNWTAKVGCRTRSTRRRAKPTFFGCSDVVLSVSRSSRPAERVRPAADEAGGEKTPDAVHEGQIGFGYASPGGTTNVWLIESFWKPMTSGNRHSDNICTSKISSTAD